MSEEKEIKVRVLDKFDINKIKNIIENLLNVKFERPRKDKDVYYDLADNFYFNINHGLRVRNGSEIAYKALFYKPDKNPNPWFVLEKEYKLPIYKKDMMQIFDIANIKCDIALPDLIDINQLKEIFRKLNFIEKIKIEKSRFSAKSEKYEICVDHIEKLGLFVEIEAKEDSFLKSIKDRLPFRYEEIRYGYTSIYAKEILNIDIPDFKSKFINNPDWNYLEGQKKLVDKIIDDEKNEHVYGEP